MKHQYPKNDKAIIMCGVTGLIVAPILTGMFMPMNLDNLTGRFCMIVLLFCSAPLGVAFGGFIGWLAGKDAE